ncbi:MAG: choice-of-anchor tandem repeat GloVer-containing protein, partial [Limisphaerales bacterium]
INGGADGHGTVFEVTTNGVLTTLYSFTGGNDGAEPEAGMALGPKGIFYGVTSFSGSGGYGTVFAITESGSLTTLYSFNDDNNGANPSAALILRANGNFYGTTAGDQSSTYGNLFEITPSGTLTNLYTFTNGNDGAAPDAALANGPDGNFYGTTYGNLSGTPFDSGNNPWGAVFELTPNGVFATLVSFDGANGGNSSGNLVLGPDGNFYGTTSGGGQYGIGEVYRLDLPPEILRQPPSQSVFTGAPVTLSVALFGTAPYSFQWLSNNVPIVAATNGTFTIPDFAVGDAANYSVMVSNDWGGAFSAAALVTAETAPVISSIAVPASGNATLNCRSQPKVASRLWAATNLAGQADWTPIFTNSVTSPDGAWQFTDTNGHDFQRYYRISTP